MHRIIALVALTATLSIAPPTQGADTKPVHTSLSGPIESVSDGGATFTIKDKQGKTLTVKPRPSVVFYTWQGEPDELVEGRAVEVSGTLDHEAKTVKPWNITVYPRKSRNSNRVFPAKRVDGILVKKGETLFVRAEHKDYEIQTSEKTRVVVRLDAGLKAIQKGKKAGLYGKLLDGVVHPNFVDVHGKPETE